MSALLCRIAMKMPPDGLDQFLILWRRTLRRSIRFFLYSFVLQSTTDDPSRQPASPLSSRNEQRFTHAPPHLPPQRAGAGGAGDAVERVNAADRHSRYGSGRTDSRPGADRRGGGGRSDI